MPFQKKKLDTRLHARTDGRADQRAAAVGLACRRAPIRRRWRCIAPAAAGTLYQRPTDGRTDGFTPDAFGGTRATPAVAGTGSKRPTDGRTRGRRALGLHADGLSARRLSEARLNGRSAIKRIRLTTCGCWSPPKRADAGRAPFTDSCKRRGATPGARTAAPLRSITHITQGARREAGAQF